LALTLRSIWPSFEWERLVADPPPGWLDNSTEEKCDLPQNVDLREVEQSVSPWKDGRVSLPGTKDSMHHLKLKLNPSEKPVRTAHVVPLTETEKTKFAPSRIA